MILRLIGHASCCFCVSFFLFFLFSILSFHPNTRKLTQSTFKMHKSEVFEHLELRVGEQVGDDEFDCLFSWFKKLVFVSYFTGADEVWYKMGRRGGRDGRT